MMKPNSLSAAIASHLEALGVSQLRQVPPLIIWFLLVLVISQSSQGFSLVKCLLDVFLNIVCC